MAKSVANALQDPQAPRRGRVPQGSRARWSGKLKGDLTVIEPTKNGELMNFNELLCFFFDFNGDFSWVTGIEEYGENDETWWLNGDLLGFRWH